MLPAPSPPGFRDLTYVPNRLQGPSVFIPATIVCRFSFNQANISILFCLSSMPLFDKYQFIFITINIKDVKFGYMVTPSPAIIKFIQENPSTHFFFKIHVPYANKSFNTVLNMPTLHKYLVLFFT
jgi:hypothetical protein